jgi:hypothetical protein
MAFGELGPIVPSGVQWVIRMCELPVAAVGRARLVVVDSTASLNQQCGVVCREGAWHGWWRWQFRGEGMLGSLSSLVGEGVLVVAVVLVLFGHVGVIDGTVIPKVGVPLWQDAVGVVAVDVQSQALATPMPHS